MTKQQVKVTMYRTLGCPFCVAAERFLDDKDVEFDQVYLDDHPDRRAFTAALLPGHDSVPLVIIDGTPVGGFDELRALDASGELERKLFP